MLSLGTSLGLGASGDLAHAGWANWTSFNCFLILFWEMLYEKNYETSPDLRSPSGRVSIDWILIFGWTALIHCQSTWTAVGAGNDCISLVSENIIFVIAVFFSFSLLQKRLNLRMELPRFPLPNFGKLNDTDSVWASELNRTNRHLPNTAVLNQWAGAQWWASAHPQVGSLIYKDSHFFYLNVLKNLHQ